jgi:hypothetical protein
MSTVVSGEGIGGEGGIMLYVFGIVWMLNAFLAGREAGERRFGRIFYLNLTAAAIGGTFLTVCFGLHVGH